VALVGAAATLIEQEGFHGLSLDVLARRAGVTRRTVYNRFGSKLGLLNAVMDDLAQRANASGFTEIAKRGDSSAAAIELLRATCGLWSVNRPLHRRLVGLAAVDPDTASVLSEREARRRGPWLVVVSRLQAEDRLRDVSADSVLAAMLQLSSFPFFDGVAAEEGDLEPTVKLLCRLAGGVVAFDTDAGEIG